MIGHEIIDMALAQLRQEGMVRTDQARHDREVFDREKRGYANRLREMFEGVELPFPKHADLRELIADLERVEPSLLSAEERRENNEDKAYAERRDGGFSAPDTDL